MAQQTASEHIGTWEKPQNPQLAKLARKNERWKFLIGGALILFAMGYLVVSGMLSGASYFITVGDLLSNPEYVGQTVRISGAVLGESIDFDAENLIMNFTIVNLPEEFDNLAVALHEAVNDPNSASVKVHIVNQPKPDLLQHEAQAILTGKLGEDGVFYATELLLKCPSRFEEANPGQEIVDPHNSAA